MQTQVTAAAATLDAEREAAANEALAKQNKPGLVKQEAIIQKGEKAFFASAKAVVEIIDEELFKPSFNDKTSYFKTRWEMTHQNLTRFENAGRVIIALEEGGFGDRLPRNEAQCRELYKQSTDNDEFNGAKSVTLWDAIFEAEETPTAKLIAEKGRNFFKKSDDDTTDESSEERPKPQSNSNPASAELRIADDQPKDRIVEHACSAKIVVLLSDSTLKDALEYEGTLCEEVGENQWAFEVSAENKSALIHELASWSRVYDLTEVTIKFE